ncbi:phospholipase [Microbacterium esteraromaticum]|uniref:Phospholipase n=1 Tax=Microbacterium esteraromaticum TaxID=57043 RepID=A0A7D8A9M1_9MICO|nr:phospholipase [Microbacterium esteraromaticum]QMU97660.1 phospholipase [Microbacterium esteraromaticum]
MIDTLHTRASKRVAHVASAHSRMRRPLIAVAVVAALAATTAAGAVFAPAALGAIPSEQALEQAADATDDGKIALVNAESLNNVVAGVDFPMQTAQTQVDLNDLTADVKSLSRAAELSSEEVADLTAEVVLGTVIVQSKTADLQDALTAAKQAEAERIRIEAERIAAEKAAEEKRRAEAALAAANTPEGAKATARAMAAELYGWGEGQFSCLVKLWTKESGWNYKAYNSNGGATGIPQALPGSKMATAGADWRTNATTQIAWGLGYIDRAYGSPCSAWGHSQAVNWY